LIFPFVVRYQATNGARAWLLDKVSIAVVGQPPKGG
jgi:hypothetical protein